MWFLNHFDLFVINMWITMFSFLHTFNSKEKCLWDFKYFLLLLFLHYICFNNFFHLLNLPKKKLLFFSNFIGILRKVEEPLLVTTGVSLVDPSDDKPTEVSIIILISYKIFFFITVHFICLQKKLLEISTRIIHSNHISSRTKSTFNLTISFHNHNCISLIIILVYV